MPISNTEHRSTLHILSLDHQGETITTQWNLPELAADGSNWTAIKTSADAIFTAYDDMTTSNIIRRSITVDIQSGAHIASTDSDSDDAQWVRLTMQENPADAGADATRTYTRTIKSPDGSISAAADGTNRIPLTTPLLSDMVSAIESHARGASSGARLLVRRAVKN